MDLIGFCSAWLHPKDMSALLPHEIESFLADDNKKRNGELHKGYQIALDSAEFVKEQRNNVRALKESLDNAQVDQLESEGAEGGEEGDDSSSTKKAKGSTTKKRKRESEAEVGKAKRGAKAATTKKESVEPVKRKSKAVKKNGTKSKALVESEDEGAEAEDDDEDDAGPSKKTSPPPAKKAKRDKDDGGDYGVFFTAIFNLFLVLHSVMHRLLWSFPLAPLVFVYSRGIRTNCVHFYFSAKGSNDPQSLKVRDWRHKLQKTFLSNKTLPKAEVYDPISHFGCHAYPLRAECTGNR